MPNGIVAVLAAGIPGFIAPQHPPGGWTAGRTTIELSQNLLGEEYDEMVEQARVTFEGGLPPLLDVHDLNGGGVGVWRLPIEELFERFAEFHVTDEWTADYWLQGVAIGKGECVVYPEDRTEVIRVVVLMGEPNGNLVNLRRIDVTPNVDPELLPEPCITATYLDAVSGGCALRTCQGICVAESILSDGVPLVVGCNCQ